jgi:tetratricopeptide (TPR) repeat protein
LGNGEWVKNDYEVLQVMRRGATLVRAILGTGLVLMLGGCQQPESTLPVAVNEEVSAAQARADKQPNSPDAWVVLGEAYLKAEMYNDAYIAFKQGWALDQKKPEALRGLAAASLQLHNPQAAGTWAVRALALNPRDSEALGLRGEAKLAKGDVTGAYADLKAAAQLAPLALSSSLALTAVHMKQGHRDLALEQAQRTSYRFPTEARAHHNYGALLDQLGRGKEAEEEYRLALECDPRDLQDKLLLAQLLVRSSRNLDEARKLALEVATKAPSDGTPAGVAARALYLKGQREQSLKELLEVQSKYRTNVLVLSWIYDEAKATGNPEVASAAAGILQRLLSQQNPS